MLGGLYNNLRARTTKAFTRWGLLNDSRRRAILRFNNAMKALITRQRNMFEGMDIRYFGPTDGHDVIELVRVLRMIKDMRGPKLLHIHTVKGKGYEPAEQNATIWHAPGRFDLESGERLHEDSSKPRPPRFQDVFGETLLELARTNPRIVGITPAMPTGCSLNLMMKEMPDRTFDVGIAEGHSATFAAGLAKEGLQPFCNIYSAFAQRAYDNIIHDAAILNLPVVFCFDRAGLVGSDGPTHHGAFDLCALRPVPNLTIASPMDEHELRRLMFTAQTEGKGTFVIRYPRGRGYLTDWRCPLEEIPVGTGRKLKDGNRLAVVTLGPIGHDVEQAIQKAESELGVHDAVAHYDLRFLKPLDEAMLNELGQKFSKVLTVEDGQRMGGMGSAVMEYLNDHGFTPRIVRLGLPDYFVEHGTVEEERRIIGLDEPSIVGEIKKLLNV